MKYYVKATEQIIANGELSEYTTDTKKNTENDAYVVYYNTLRNVSNDLYTEDTPDKKHTYLRISVEETTGRVLKLDTLGAYLESLVSCGGYYDNGKFYGDSDKQNEITGKEGVVYIDIPSKKKYKWDGEKFVEV